MTFTEDKTVADAYAELKLAYESGVNFFDNSESYGETSQGWVRGGVSEVIMGQAVQLGIKEKLWGRMDLVISTKLMWGGRGTLRYAKQRWPQSQAPRRRDACLARAHAVILRRPG